MEGNCQICGRYSNLQIHHMLHGSMRKLADEDGLTIKLCPRCHGRLHDTGWMDKELQAEAEERWLNEDHSRTVEDFVKRYGKNYL